MRGIKTKGQYIIESTNFDLFWGRKATNGTETFEKKKYSIVYGRNGSGKTTIAKAFSDYKNDITDTFETCFYDENMNEIFPDKENIYVFSESFTNDNVMVSEDGNLNAIVLFGKATDIDKEINQLKAEIESNVKLIEAEDVDKYHRYGDKCNVDKAFSDISDELKNHWASREQQLRGLKKKASVDSDLIKTICEMKKPTETKQELDNTFTELLDNIEKVRNIGNEVSPITLDFIINSKGYYNSLLVTSFSKDQMSSFALGVLELVEKNSSKYINDSKEILKNNDRCPLCFQPIDKTYSENTLKIIDLLFDERIEIEKHKIEQSFLKQLEVPDFQVYEGIVSLTLISNLEKEISEYNKMCLLINNALQSKIGAIYSPVSQIEIDIDSRKQSLQNAIDNINDEISIFNSNVKNKDKIITKAKTVNISIAYIECANLIKRYHSLVEDEKNTKEKVDNLTKANNKDEDKIRELNAQKKNYSIALSEINKCLAYIFTSSSRLKLQQSDDASKYFILSKGKKVKAKKLSTGERNAISLVYYYEQLKQNCIEGEYFKKEGIYIIDDPISSFDYENKLGILSFIKRIMLDIKNGNENSKIMLLTHEMEIASYINRIMVDLNMSSNSCCLELNNSGVKIINSFNYTQYKTLINEVVEYGENERFENDISIGNTIRRLVEAYASFNYRESMDKFLTKNEYIDKIQDESLREYFQSRMNRLVLNEQSHSENVMRQVPDIMDFDLFSREEKIQTAKDVIVFLYCLDKTHINRYLPPEKERIIRGWMETIKNGFIS